MGHIGCSCAASGAPRPCEGACHRGQGGPMRQAGWRGYPVSRSELATASSRTVRSGRSQRAGWFLCAGTQPGRGADEQLAASWAGYWACLHDGRASSAPGCCQARFAAGLSRRQSRSVFPRRNLPSGTPPPG